MVCDRTFVNLVLAFHVTLSLEILELHGATSGFYLRGILFSSSLFSDFKNSSDVQDSIKISKFVVGKILIVLYWVYTGILFLVFWGAAIQDWHWFLGLVLGWLPAFIGIVLMSFVLWLSIILLGINSLIFIFPTDMNFAQVFLGPIGLNFRAAYFLIGLYT